MAFKRSAVRSRLSPPGRLAQLVAHPLDVREVTSSSLVSSTIEKPRFSVVFRVFRYFWEKTAQQLVRRVQLAAGLQRLTSSGFLFCSLLKNFAVLQALLQTSKSRPGFRAGAFIFSCILRESPPGLAPARCPSRTLPAHRSASRALCRGLLLRCVFFAGTTSEPVRPGGRSFR